MFDLFRSREKVVRILLGVILVVVSLSMLTYLVPNYNTGSSSSDTVVAEVGKDVLTVADVQQALQNATRNRQMPPSVMPTFVPQLVDEMILDRAMAYQAARQGFQVTDADLAEAIRGMVPSLFPDGKFVGKEMYAAMLAQQNMSIDEFERNLKRQLLVTRMRNIALEGTIVSQVEIETTYKKNNEKLKIEYVKLAPEKFRAEVQPNEEDLRNFYKANLGAFQIPEKRGLAVLVADQAKLEQTVSIPDADLQRLYTQNQNQFRTPERVKVRHILLKTTEKPAAEEPKIKALAGELLKQIRGGADFAELAKKNSEDTASAVKGGDLDWVARGQTVPEFEQMAFTLKPGQTSDLVKTQYGYHIIQVQQHEDARLRPYDEVKAELATQAKRQRVSAMLENISDHAQAALQKDPAHPEQVAAQYNMQLVRVESLEPGRPIPEIGVSPEFDQSLANLKQGEVSQPVALQGNKIALAVVTNVVPGRAAAFEEVQSQVRDRVIQNRLSVAVQNKAAELVANAKSMGGDLAKAAKSMGLEVKTSDEFMHSGEIAGLGSAAYFQEAFSRPVGAVFGPVAVTDSTVVAKVVARVEPDMSKLAEQRSTIRDQIKSEKARDRNVLFEAGVKDELERKGKLKIHQDVIKRLISGYRG